MREDRQKKVLTNIDDTTMVPKMQRGNIIYTYGAQYFKYATYLIIFFLSLSLFVIHFSIYVTYVTLFIRVLYHSHSNLSSTATLFPLLRGYLHISSYYCCSASLNGFSPLFDCINVGKLFWMLIVMQ